VAAVHYRYATVRGRRLFYRAAGPGGGPVVVLLHGFHFLLGSHLDTVADHVRHFLGRTVP
jgi:pimeloyl-ACP methyl ester carboxylesterase